MSVLAMHSRRSLTVHLPLVALARAVPPDGVGFRSGAPRWRREGTVIRRFAVVGVGAAAIGAGA